MHSAPHISEMVVLWFITDCSALLRSGLTRLQNANITEATVSDCTHEFLPETNSPVPQRTSGGTGWVTVFSEKIQSGLRPELRTSDSALMILGTASYLNFAAGSVHVMNQTDTHIQT